MSLPRNLDEAFAWFAALTATDLSNALLGLATLGIAGALVCGGLWLLLRVR